MQLDRTYNAAEMPESQSFEPVPAGWYTARVANAEVKQTRAGNGSYISVRFDVTGPSHEGRVIFTNINISNPNPKAEEIGHQQLGELMRAINLGTLQDTDQLIGGACQIKVKIRRSEEYGDQNEVQAYKATSGSPAPGPAPSEDDIPLPGDAPASAPPWAS